MITHSMGNKMGPARLSPHGHQTNHTFYPSVGFKKKEWHEQAWEGRWSVWVWLAGRAAVGLAPPPFHSPGCGRAGGRQGRCLSHLIGGAQGRPAELADLPGVFPGHHPSPPETPTYHALAAGVQAQWRRALRFAAGTGDTEKGGD